MAARKKAKGRSKAKPKRKQKARAKKPVARRKVAKKKVPAKRKPARAKKAAARRAPAKRARPAAPEAMAPPGERIGIVTHYFSHLSVAVVKLETGRLRVGDQIHIRGHTTDFAQRVDSLQVAHASVAEVGPSDDFGIKVRDHAREHDVVYKVG